VVVAAVLGRTKVETVVQEAWAVAGMAQTMVQRPAHPALLTLALAVVLVGLTLTSQQVVQAALE